MEFKRSNSSRGPLTSARRRTPSSTKSADLTDTPPARRATPTRRGSGSSARGSPAAPLPPRANTSTSSARGKPFQRSASGTGSRSALTSGNTATPGSSFQRSNTAVGIQKAEKAKNKSRVNVYARVRAFAPHEENGDRGALAVRMSDETVEVNVPKKGKFTFSFDGCFWSNDRECPTGKEYASQLDVFEEVGRPLVENALAGYNAAVMAYGQTGSGKTYTSFGPVGSLGTAEEGLIPRVCNMIFARAATSAAKGVRYTVSASMLEVYLEDVFDLLNHRKQLSVRNDFKNNTFQVVGSKSIAVRSYKDVLAVLNKAEPLRTFAATNIHDHSSRAHTLFMLEVQTHFDSSDLAPRCAKILLADLAGCERIRLAGTEEGLAFEQARNINLSLLALGSCIEAVATRGKNETRPIPEFRNSTLTKLLKDYLGGNSISTMMVTIAPSMHDANLSVQTLRFADRAKQITTHAKVNTVTVAQTMEDGRDISDHLRDEYLRKKEALYAEYQLQTTIEKLLARISELEDQLRACTGEDLLRHLTTELEEQQQKLADADYQLGLARQVLYGEFLMLEDELRELNAKMQEMRAEHEEAIEGLLGEETGRFEEMRRTYEQRIDVLNRTLEEREESLGAGQDEIAQLRRRVAELEEQLRAKQAECDDLNRRLAELQEQSDADAAAASARAAELEEQLEAVRGLLSQSESEGAAQRQAASAQRDSMNAVIEALRGDVARLEEDVRVKESSGAELGQQLEERAATLVEVQQSHVQEKESLGAVIAELRTNVSTNENTIAVMEEKLEQTEEALQETSEKLEEIEEALQEKTTEAENLSQDLSDTKEKLEQTEEALQETSEKLEQTEEALQETSEKLEQTEEALQETSEKLEQTEEALQEKTTEADNLSQDLSDTKEKLEQTEEALQETSEKLEQTEEALQETSEKLEQTEEVLQDTAAKLEETEGRLEQTEDALREKGSEAENLSQDLADTKEKLEQTEEALQETSEKLEQTEEALQEKTSEADNLSQDLADTKEKLEQTEEALQETSEKLEQTEEALQDKTTEADNLSQDLADTKEKLEQTEEALQETSEKLEQTEEVLQDTAAKLEETEGRLEQVEEALREKGSEADNLSQDLADTKEKLEQTEEALQDTAAKLEETEQHLGEEISQLEGCLAFARRECVERDAYMDNLLEYVRRSYDVTLQSVSAQQIAALEEMMAVSDHGLTDLSGSVAREAARFDMLRRVLGKIGDEVKTANTEVDVQEARQRSPEPQTARLRDISERENSLPMAKQRPVEL